MNCMKHTDKDFNEFDNDGEIKSKTQLKQRADELKKLGLQLLDLSPADLQKIPLSSALHDALVLARKINRKKDGFRRQIQFIGKLLRDDDIEPIHKAIVAIQNTHQIANAHFHKLESIRDRLIEQGDPAVQGLLDQYPHGDRQQLRQLIRQAKKQQQENKPPKASREIFQYLKQLLQQG